MKKNKLNYKIIELQHGIYPSTRVIKIDGAEMGDLCPHCGKGGTFEFPSKESAEDYMKNMIESLDERFDDVLKQIQEGPKTETEELRDKEELEKTLGHRDTCFSIMYDLLRNDTIPDDKKLMIIKIVVDEQCGQELNLSQQIIYECYYHRVFI